MKFKATVQVRLRKDHSDPESETVKKSLLDLNFSLSDVRVAKLYEIIVDSGSKKDAESIVKAMCTRLLVNPTRDNYDLEVVPIGSTEAGA
jgi:phosphoribosylformylglycinamidine synthase subunit PurS